VPSDSTFFRVLNLVDPAHFESIVAAWLFEQDPGQIERLAVDGKVLRGTGPGDGKPIALLSLVTHQLLTTLRSVQIAEKSNEIPAIKPLITAINLQGCTVTADAMHCQQETARFITRVLGGDYIFGLKGNQSGILERAGLKLSPGFYPPESEAKWHTGNGKKVCRRIKTVSLSPEHRGLCGCCASSPWSMSPSI
jgi:hypothetical protein